MKGVQHHSMFTSSVYSTLGADFSKLREGNELIWYQFHVKGWVS